MPRRSHPGGATGGNEASQAGILTWGHIVASVSDLLLPVVVVRFVEIGEVGAIVALLLIYRTIAAVLTGGFPRTALYYLADGGRNRRWAVVRRLHLIMVMLAGVVALLLVVVRWAGPGALRLVETWNVRGEDLGGLGLGETLEYLPLLGLYAFVDLPVRLLREILIAEGRARAAAAFAIATSIGSTLVVLVPVVLGFGLPGIVYAHLALGLLFLGWHLTLIRGLYGGAAGCRPPSFGRLVGYAVPLGLTDVVNTMLASLDLWLVLLFLSLEEVALYKSGAWQIPVLGTLAYVVGSVYLPRFARMFRAGEKRQALELWRASALKLSLLVVPASLAVFVAAREIVTVLFTSVYVGATPVLRCYCLLAMIRVTAFGSFVVAAGKPGYVLRGAVVTLITNVAISLPLVFVIGYVGPAIGTAAGIAPMMLVYCYFISRAWGVGLRETFPLWGYLRVVLVAIPPALFAHWIRSTFDLSPGSRILAVVAAVGLGFAGLGSLLGVIDRGDWRFAASWFRHSVLRFRDVT